MKEVRRTPVPLPGTNNKSKTKDRALKPPLSQEFIESEDDSTSIPTPSTTTIAIHRPNGSHNSKASARATLAEQSPKRSGPKQINAQQAVRTSESDTSSDSDGHSNSTSSEDPSEETDEQETQKSTQKPSHTYIEPPRLQSYASQSRPASAFAPPRGFNPVPLNEKTISTAANALANLQGKEIWHITAPAGVSLKDMREMALDKISGGAAVLDYKGSRYGFASIGKSEESEREILLPSKNGYRAVSSHIARTLHLQAVVRLPKHSADASDQARVSEAAASITRSTIRAPRPQVKGLRMRFLPIGFGGPSGGVLGDSESEDDKPQPIDELRKPHNVKLPIRKEKRKLAETTGSTPTDAPSSKKHKKVRTPEELKRKEEKKSKRAKA